MYSVSFVSVAYAWRIFDSPFVSTAYYSGVCMTYLVSTAYVLRTFRCCGLCVTYKEYLWRFKNTFFALILSLDICKSNQFTSSIQILFASSHKIQMHLMVKKR